MYHFHHDLTTGVLNVYQQGNYVCSFPTQQNAEAFCDFHNADQLHFHKDIPNNTWMVFGPNGYIRSFQDAASAAAYCEARNKTETSVQALYAGQG